MNRDGTLFFFFFLLFTRGGCVSCLRTCLGARLLPQSYQDPNLSEGADRVAGQLRGNKECPFSGVTKSGRVWRKVPESDARSVCVCVWGGGGGGGGGGGDAWGGGVGGMGGGGGVGANHMLTHRLGGGMKALR